MLRLATFTFATLALAGAACADTPVERGAYLVNTIMTCGNCHSPKGPPDVVAGEDGDLPTDLALKLRELGAW